MPVDQQDQEVSQEGLVLEVPLGQLEQQEKLDLKESQLALLGHPVLLATKDHLDPSLVSRVQLAPVEKMVQLDKEDFQVHQDLLDPQVPEDQVDNLDLVALLAYQARVEDKAQLDQEVRLQIYLDVQENQAQRDHQEAKLVNQAHQVNVEHLDNEVNQDRVVHQGHEVSQVYQVHLVSEAQQVRMGKMVPPEDLMDPLVLPVHLDHLGIVLIYLVNVGKMECPECRVVQVPPDLLVYEVSQARKANKVHEVYKVARDPVVEGEGKHHSISEICDGLVLISALIWMTTS